MDAATLLTDWAIPIAGCLMLVLVMAAAFVAVDARRCRCGRVLPRPLRWWGSTWRWHSNSRGLVVAVGFSTALLAWWVYCDWWGAVIVEAAFLARDIAILVWHQWPRIKRAARSAGRVVTDAAGRLVIRPEPSPGAA